MSVFIYLANIFSFGNTKYLVLFNVVLSKMHLNILHKGAVAFHSSQ